MIVDQLVQEAGEYQPHSGDYPDGPVVYLNDQEEGTESKEDEPLLGTRIPKEASEKAVKVIRRVLGFEEEAPLTTDQSRRVSRLSLHAPSTSKPSMPVDDEASERIENMFAKGLYKKAPSVSWFTSEEKHVKELFTAPKAPEAAMVHGSSIAKAQED